MRAYFWGLHFLGCGKEFGRHGHAPNAASLYGWLLTTDVGQRIAVGSLIPSVALCVTRLLRPFITS